MVVNATATYEDPMTFTTPQPRRAVELHHGLGHYPEEQAAIAIGSISTVRRRIAHA